MRRITSTLAIALLALSFAPSSSAQETGDDLRQEVEALKQGQQQIQQQLEEIRKLIAARPAAPARPSGPNVAGKVFDLADNPFKGESTAKLTLVDFTDYQ